jgi:hypothetical protein
MSIWLRIPVKFRLIRFIEFSLHQSLVEEKVKTKILTVQT